MGLAPSTAVCMLVGGGASVPPQGRRCFGGVLVLMEAAYWVEQGRNCFGGTPVWIGGLSVVDPQGNTRVGCNGASKVVGECQNFACQHWAS